MPDKTNIKPGDSCSFTFCEDPETGEVIAVPGPECPKGFIKRVTEKAKKEGITFRIPNISIEDDPEYQEFMEWKKWKAEKSKK